MKNVLLIVAITFFSNSIFAITDYTNSDDTTRIKTKNKTYLIIDSEDDDFSFEEDTNGFNEEEGGLEVILTADFGMNGYLTPDYSMNLPEPQRMMELNSSGSRALSVNFMLKGAKIVKDWFYISPGIGVTANSYSFKNNIHISTGSDTTMFTADTILSNDKYELSATYLQVPLVLGFRIGNPDKKRVGIQIGAIGAYKIVSKINQKYYLAANDTKEKHTIVDDFNIHPFKMDLIVRVSVGKIGLFGKSSFTALFEKTKAAELYPFSVGFTFGGF
jgi:hypothetical protein